MEHIDWNKLVGFVLSLSSPETSPIISWHCYNCFLTNHFVCQVNCCLDCVFFHNFINQAQFQCFSCRNMSSCDKKRNKVTTVGHDGQLMCSWLQILDMFIIRYIKCITNYMPQKHVHSSLSPSLVEAG